jgi:hypothetical protein
LAFRFVFASALGIAAAAVLGASDVLVKIVAASHCDVLTMLSFRSVIGLAFMAVWLRLGGAPVPANVRVRWISIGIGVLLTVLLYCLFEAIDLNDVSTAVLTYFVYPLLTGIAAAATGLERLRWQGIACALAAFGGLAIMIGAHPAGLVLAGIAFALAAAVCRTDYHARFPGRRRRAVDDLVFGHCAGRHLCCALRDHADVAATADQRRLGGAGRHESGDHRRHRLHLCVHHARRSVSHRACHESRAHDRDGGKCRGARRHDHAAARTRQRHNASGSGGVPIAEMKLTTDRCRAYLRARSAFADVNQM